MGRYLGAMPYLYNTVFDMTCSIRHRLNLNTVSLNPSVYNSLVMISTHWSFQSETYQDELWCTESKCTLKDNTRKNVRHYSSSENLQIILCTDDSQNGTVILLMRLYLGSISIFQVLTFSTGALSTNAI